MNDFDFYRAKVDAFLAQRSAGASIAALGITDAAVLARFRRGDDAEVVARIILQTNEHAPPPRPFLGWRSFRLWFASLLRQYEAGTYERRARRLVSLLEDLDYDGEDVAVPWTVFDEIGANEKTLRRAGEDPRDPGYVHDLVRDAMIDMGFHLLADRVAEAAARSFRDEDLAA